MKKIILLVICIGLILCGCNDSDSLSGGVGKGSVTFEGYNGPSDAVMTVNGEAVSVDEFNYFLIMSAYDIKNANGSDESDLNTFFSKVDESSKKTFGELAVDEAVKRCTEFHIFRTEALKQGVSLTEEDVENIQKQANSMKDNYGENMNILQLRAGGLTPKVYADITEMSFYSNKLFSKFVGEYKTITDEDMEKFYRENYVRAKHILVMTVNPETGEQLSQEEQKAALDEVSEVFEKIKAGEDFDRLMAEHTDDTGYQLKPDGYTFTMDDEYTMAFKETAFSLSEGQVSDQIVKSEYGYHIIKREPLQEDFVSVSFEEIQDKIFRADFQKMLDKANAEAVIIGNEPVFKSMNPAKVLGDYLAILDETHELIKQEFIKMEENAQ